MCMHQVWPQVKDLVDESSEVGYTDDRDNETGCTHTPYNGFKPSTLY